MTAPKRPQDHKSKAPTKAEAVDFDLDVLEREGDRKPPFTFRLGGEKFTFDDPGDIDFVAFEAMWGTPGGDIGMVRMLLGDDQYQKFAKNGVPNWKIWALFGAWQSHYGVTSLGKSDD